MGCGSFDQVALSFLVAELHLAYRMLDPVFPTVVLIKSYYNVLLCVIFLFIPRNNLFYLLENQHLLPYRLPML